MKLNYIKHKLMNLISINKIVSIHYYELDRSFCFQGESHNFWELVYVDSGEIIINANDCEYQLKQGEVIFHKPNEFHTLKADSKTASNVFVISFVCSSEAMSFFRDKIMVVPKKLKVHITSILEEYYFTFNPMDSKALKLEVRDDPLIGGQQMIKTHLEQFLIRLIRSEENNREVHFFSSKENMDHHLIAQILNIIEENTYTKITVEQICNKLDYSHTYLSKIFKSTTGYTILEYIQKNKIQEAKKLIREERYNFAQISELLSFENPYYFSRVFKRVANMTPTEYKNSAKKV